MSKRLFGDQIIVQPVGLRQLTLDETRPDTPLFFAATGGGAAFRAASSLTSASPGLFILSFALLTIPLIPTFPSRSIASLFLERAFILDFVPAVPYLIEDEINRWAESGWSFLSGGGAG